MECCGFEVVMVFGVEVVMFYVFIYMFVFVVVDMWLEDGNGLDIVEMIYKVCLDVCVVMLMGYGNIIIVVVVVKLGVIDYLVKFVDVDDVEKVLLVKLDEKLVFFENFMFVDWVCWEYI